MKTPLLALAVAVVALIAPAAAAADDKLVCRTDPILMPWKHLQGIKAPGAPVHFWFDERKAADKARAKAYAKETGDRIWPKLRSLTGRKPLSDAKVGCRHGSDGGLDVYIFRGEIEDLNSSGAQAVTVPFDVQVSCRPHAPQMILVRPGLHRAKLAHEIFHAFTSAYARKSKDCEVYGPWDEAMATWAMDFIYPKDQVEHEQRFNMDMPQFPIHMAGGYGGWAFLRYLTATQGGAKRIRDILEAEERQPPVKSDIDPVVDGAIPGGFDKRLPEYALHAWNATPVPTAPITRSFKGWDRWDAVPMIGTKKQGFKPTPRVDVALQGSVERVDTLLRTKSGVNALGREYFHYRFEDEDVRHIEMRNPLAGVPGAHLNGFMRVNGKWEVIDWSADKTKTFCRDNPAEDVRELVLIVSNGDFRKSIGGTRPELRSTASCGLTVQVTAFRETGRDSTDLGWSTSDHHLVSAGPPSRVVVIGPDDDRPDYDNHQAVCERGGTCTLNLFANTENTTDGLVDGPNLADDPCPYRYGVRTFGPFQDNDVATMEIDLTGPKPQAFMVDSVGPLEVGDSTENMCSGRSRGHVDDSIRTPVPWDQLMSGEPVTLQWASSGVQPTERGSASGTINWDYATTITLQRVSG